MPSSFIADLKPPPKRASYATGGGCGGGWIEPHEIIAAGGYFGGCIQFIDIKR